MEIVEIKDKQKFFNNNYPFKSVPKLTDKKFCIHCFKWFCVKDYKVILSDGEKLIVCPNYPDCDGSVIDWFDVDITKPFVP